MYTLFLKKDNFCFFCFSNRQELIIVLLFPPQLGFNSFPTGFYIFYLNRFILPQSYIMFTG